MLSYEYNPFRKDLDSIAGSDLVILRNVVEGWYIDYKRKLESLKDIAKHLSGFANQYGGWIVVGVEESSELNTAGRFVGIEESDLGEFLIRLREASSAHVNPEILYETKVIYGPVKEIGLEEEKIIVLIGIPRSENTPHIHSSGRIYRRIGDQMAPKEVKERHSLDELWIRAEKKRKSEIARFTDKPELPKGFENTPIVHIYYKLSDKQLPPKERITFEEFTEIVKGNSCSENLPSMPFQEIVTTVFGFSARQIENNIPNAPCAGIHWFYDGVARIDIPLNVHEINFQRGLVVYPSESLKNYCEILKRNGYEVVTILDCSYLLKVIMGMTGVFLNMLRATDDSREIYASYTTRNIFGGSPYLDSEKFFERASINGPPYLLNSEIQYPLKPTQDNMISLDKILERFVPDDKGNNEYKQFLLTASVASSLLTSLGIVNNDKEFMVEISSLYESMNKS